MKNLLLALLLLPSLLFAQAKVDTISVFSPSMKKTLKAAITFPASYENGKSSYPVVYLLHGGSGAFSDWHQKVTEKGIVNQLAEEHQVLIGFALETEKEEFHALEKLQKKNLDCIVLNSQNNPEAGFGVDTNAVTVFCNDGKQWQIPTASKTEVAEKLLQSLSEWLTQTH